MQTIPAQVLQEMTEKEIIVTKSAFYQWAGIEPKRGFMQRMFGNG